MLLLVVSESEGSGEVTYIHYAHNSSYILEGRKIVD